ncbi:MAG: squalene/phytoene synthase family protein [Akkermansiaceae bacterium]
MMTSHSREILKNVSRSFYLSIRLLPAAMREPVSLGYLLARISDTLADTANLPADIRLQSLCDFRKILHGADATPWLERVKSEIIPHQTHTGERALLENIQPILDWLHSLSERDATGASPYESITMEAQQHAAILTVMGHILRGQQLDIERFELQENFQLTLDSELEEYCYLVAGCVGEFWTEIGFVSLGDFSSVAPARLKQWGANYGKALQLINIIRDLPKDIAGAEACPRCYLPNVDTNDRDALMAEAARWRARARSYLENGVQYTETLTSRRTRIATALPGLIGSGTLDLLDQADWQAWSNGVKVPRSEVYHCVWQAMFA